MKTKRNPRLKLQSKSNAINKENKVLRQIIHWIKLYGAGAVICILDLCLESFQLK